MGIEDYFRERSTNRKAFVRVLVNGRPLSQSLRASIQTSNLMESWHLRMTTTSPLGRNERTGITLKQILTRLHVRSRRMSCFKTTLGTRQRMTISHSLRYLRSLARDGQLSLKKKKIFGDRRMPGNGTSLERTLPNTQRHHSSESTRPILKPSKPNKKQRLLVRGRGPSMIVPLPYRMLLLLSTDQRQHL